MRYRIFLFRIVLASALFAFVVPPANADQACYDELAVILAAFQSPPTGIEASAFDEASRLLNELMKQCQEGATLANVQPTVESLRSLLGVSG